MKILYKPFGIIASLVGAKIANNVFRSVWTRIDERAPPRATTEDASFQKVVGAAALEAATTAAIGAAVDRATARTFHYLTGIWPGVHREPALPGTALEQKQIEQQQQIEQQEQ